MNSYSLASDSRRWWWPSAAAGTLGSVAVAAILAVPATGSVAHDRTQAPAPVTTGSGTVVERPCYLARPGWNTVRGWEQPVCETLLRDRTDDASGVRRPAPYFMP